MTSSKSVNSHDKAIKKYTLGKYWLASKLIVGIAGLIFLNSLLIGFLLLALADWLLLPYIFLVEIPKNKAINVLALLLYIAGASLIFYNFVPYLLDAFIFYGK